MVNTLEMARKSKRVDWAPLSEAHREVLREKMEGKDCTADVVRQLVEEDYEFREVWTVMMARFQSGSPREREKRAIFSLARIVN